VGRVRQPLFDDKAEQKGVTYGIDLQIPRLPRLIQINYDLVVGQSKLFDGNMSPLRPWTTMIGVKRDLGCGCHHEVVNTSQ
jgi:hypothetical protein